MGTPKACANPTCGGATAQSRKGRCEPCYRHFMKYGVERPAPAVPTAGLPPPTAVLDEDVPDHGGGMQEVRGAHAGPDARDVAPTLVVDGSKVSPASQGLPAVPTASDAFMEKVRIIMDLAAQGADAVAAAVRAGRVGVRVGRRESGGRGAAIDPALVRAILDDRDAGLSYRAIERKHGLGHGNGTAAWTVCKREGRVA